MNTTLKVLTVFVASIVFVNEFLRNKNFISGFQKKKTGSSHDTAFDY